MNIIKISPILLFDWLQYTGRLTSTKPVTSNFSHTFVVSDCEDVVFLEVVAEPLCFRFLNVDMGLEAETDDTNFALEILGISI